jgi:hypothetical protein
MVRRYERKSMLLLSRNIKISTSATYLAAKAFAAAKKSIA